MVTYWMGNSLCQISSCFLQPQSVIAPVTATHVVQYTAEDIILQERILEEKAIKILLLGPEESGKSTVLKQMKIVHGDGYSIDELRGFKPLIYSNVIQSMIQLLNGCRRLNIVLDDEYEDDINIIMSLSSRIDRIHEFPDDVYHAMQCLWINHDVQEAYSRRSEFYINDNAQYFIDALDRLIDPEYIPTRRDVLYARTITKGVTELKFENQDKIFRIIDVGGQKTARRKWIHLFDNMKAVLFLAAISDYDQVLEEDNETNRLHDALMLFNSIVNHESFRLAQIILFLNKKDIFKEKIDRTPLTVCFPNYKYKNDYVDGTAYIKKKFEQYISREKTLYTHFTCATNTDNMQFVIDSVTRMIIEDTFRTFF